MLIYLLILVILQSCAGSEEVLKNDVFDHLQKYKLLDDGVSITTVEGMDSILRSGHDCNSQLVSSIKQYNRGGKRDNTIMVTGDLPLFAMMRTYPENNLSPDLIKLGDARIRIAYNSKLYWLDSLPDIVPVFEPGISFIKLKFHNQKILRFHLKYSMRETGG